MMVVTPGAISEERAAALRKSAEVEKPKYRVQVFENDEYRTLSSFFCRERSFWCEKYKAIGKIRRSNRYNSKAHARHAYKYNQIRWYA
jgi:hypothetical protein